MTFGLIVTILAGVRFARDSVPWLVGLYTTAACWFTASTSFANPAVAIARSLTKTFSGIRPIDLPGLIVAQLLGAICGMVLAGWLIHPPANAGLLHVSKEFVEEFFAPCGELHLAGQGPVVRVRG